MRQSSATHKDSIKSNLGQYCFEKDSKAFQEPNNDAAEKCAKYIKFVGSEPSIVELGCGDGASLRKFQELGFSTLGVDINSAKLAHASGVTVNMDMLEFLKTQADGTLNNIFMHHSLEHIVDVVDLLKEIPRVLKSGGIFFCVVPADDYPHEVHHTAFDSADELAPAGFEQLSCERQERYGHPEYIYVGLKL